MVRDSQRSKLKSRLAFKKNKVKYSLPRAPQIFKEKRKMPQAAIEALRRWRETKAAERK